MFRQKFWSVTESRHCFQVVASSDAVENSVVVEKCYSLEEYTCLAGVTSLGTWLERKTPALV
jgi:hypothetical protein